MISLGDDEKHKTDKACNNYQHPNNKIPDWMNKKRYEIRRINFGGIIFIKK